MSGDYIPAPIDTSNVKLEPCLLELTELIAKNTHENWAHQRLERGWTLGKERNDDLKTTPCLVPYEDLSEAEKIYDRQTSMEVLKTIVKLGFKITREEG